MIDFLTSLVDRALDRTTVLQRRQPTLFEPVAEAVFSEQSEPENMKPLEEEEIVVGSRPSSTQQKLSVSNSSRLPQLTSQREEPESQPVETRPPRRRRVHDSPEPRKVRNSEPLEPSVSFAPLKEPKTISHEEPSRALKTPVVAKPQEIAVMPPRAIETIVERRVEREIIKEHSTDTPAIKEVHTFAQPNSQPKLSRDNDGEQPKQPLKPEVKRLSPPKEQTTVQPLILKKPGTRRDPLPFVRPISRAESKHPLKQPTPPVIQVTIGRVEVRATPAAAVRPRVSQPAGPKLGLEDYLRSRGERN